MAEREYEGPNLGWIDFSPAFRRVALWGMIGALVALSLVAIGVLLFGTFNRTSENILATLGALAFHCGALVWLARSRDRGLLPWLAQLGAAAFVLSFGVMVVDIWWPRLYGQGAEKSVWEAILLSIMMVLVMPPAGLLRMGRSVALARITFALCGGALAYFIFLIWADPPGEWYKWGSVALVTAFTLSHVCLLLRLRLREVFGRVRIAAIVLAGATGLLLSVFIARDGGLYEEFLLRLLGASAVADGCLTVSLLILKYWRGLPASETEGRRRVLVEIRCPRCSAECEITTGTSSCTACGLKFSLEIDSDRCVACGYLLAGLPDRVCPECGTGF